MKPMANIGVLAGNKIATYHENQASNYLSNIAFMSKAELRKTIESMQMEITRYQTKLHFVENDNRTLRDENINLRMEEIKKYRETKEVFMQVAI